MELSCCLWVCHLAWWCIKMSVYWGSKSIGSQPVHHLTSLVLTSLCYALNSHVILSKFMPWPLPSQSHRLWRDKESVSQFSHSVMSDSLWPQGLQHIRLPCPSPSPGTCWNSCPLSHWCHPTISSSVVPFSSCFQSFPALGSFLRSHLHIRWLKYWSFSFSISPSNECSGLISFKID